MESDLTLPPEGVSTPALTSLFQTTDATPVRGVAHAYTSTSTAVENTLALITSFIPDSWCHDRYWILEDAGTTTISSGGPDRLYSPCMPVCAATYSPGLCPAPMDVVYVNRLVGDTYTEVCCQSGFSYDLQRCLKRITASTEVLDGRSVTTTDISTPIVTGTASHDPFTVLWEVRDLPLFPSDVSVRRRSIETFGFRPATPTAASDGGNDTSQTVQQQGATLAAGAIAGIVIGAVIATVLISVTAWCLWRKRRRRRGLETRRGAGAELDAAHTATWKRWLHGEWRAELDTDNARGKCTTELSELPATSPVIRQT